MQEVMQKIPEMHEKMCFVAGKSGGHIIPAITQARESNSLCLFITTQSALDKKLLEESRLSKSEHIALATGTNSLNSWFKLPVFLITVLKDFLRSLVVLRKQKVKKIISMGGLVSLPVCLAGWFLRIPVILYELNAVPGKAVRFLAPFSAKIYVCFKEAAESIYLKKYACKLVLTQYPVKYKHPNNNKNSNKKTCENARKELGIPEDAHVLCVIGGSQGSQALNAIVQNCSVILKEQYRLSRLVILHQAGVRDVSMLQAFYKQHDIAAHVVAYVDLELWYQAADIVITRAGSGSLHELAYLEKSSVIIPLEHVADDHQVANAYAIQRKHPAFFTVIRQQDAQKDTALLAQAVIKSF